MTIEQVKEEAKTRFDRELTDEQARAWLDAHPAGELQDDELADVAGGGCGKMKPCERCGCVKYEYDYGDRSHSKPYCANCELPYGKLGYTDK